MFFSKISIMISETNKEKDFLDDIDSVTAKPKKKQLSEHKLKHLVNIRVKALEVKQRDEENNRQSK